MFAAGDYSQVELAAFIAGFTGQTFTLVEFMAQVKRRFELGNE